MGGAVKAWGPQFRVPAPTEKPLSKFHIDQDTGFQKPKRKMIHKLIWHRPMTFTHTYAHAYVKCACTRAHTHHLVFWGHSNSSTEKPRFSKLEKRGWLMEFATWRTAKVRYLIYFTYKQNKKKAKENQVLSFQISFHTFIYASIGYSSMKFELLINLLSTGHFFAIF